MDRYHMSVHCKPAGSDPEYVDGSLMELGATLIRLASEGAEVTSASIGRILAEDSEGGLRARAVERRRLRSS